MLCLEARTLGSGLWPATESHCEAFKCHVTLEEGDGTVISPLLVEHLSRSQPQEGSSVLIQSHWLVYRVSHWRMCVDTDPLAGVQGVPLAGVC